MPVVNKICKTLPEGTESIKEAYERVPEFTFAMRFKERELKDMIALEGLMSHTSMHAAGVAVANQRITDIVPCMTTSEDRTMLITQWHKKILEEVGIYKFDILGLKTLTILKMTMQNILQNKGITVSLSSIDLSNPKLYEYLREGHLEGIFQFDAPAGKKAIEDIQPTCFNDIVAAESLCRPGVKEANLYYRNKKLYEETGDYPKPYYWDDVKDILEETYGAIVYQEQTMLLMNKIAGWTLGKADKMRKVKDLEEYREDFVSSAVNNGYTSQLANDIYDRFDLAYSFNKSHAAAYAVRSMQCAYFACYYPVEFMTAVLSLDVLGEGENVKSYIQTCKQRGIQILPPNINESEEYFKCSGDSILFPLTSIHNVGGAAVEAIISARPFSGVFDFIERVPKKKANKTAVSQLIKAGAFDLLEDDKYHGNRSGLLNAYKQFNNEAADQTTWCTQMLLQYELDTFGFHLTAHPLDSYSTKDMRLIPDGLTTNYFIIDDVRVSQDRNGNNMAFVTASNQFSTATIILFARDYPKYASILLPMTKIQVTGRKDGDNLIANKVVRL